MDQKSQEEILRRLDRIENYLSGLSERVEKLEDQLGEEDAPEPAHVAAIPAAPLEKPIVPPPQSMPPPLPAIIPETHPTIVEQARPIFIDRSEATPPIAEPHRIPRN